MDDIAHDHNIVSMYSSGRGYMKMRAKLYRTRPVQIQEYVQQFKLAELIDLKAKITQMKGKIRRD